MLKNFLTFADLWNSNSAFYDVDFTMVVDKMNMFKAGMSNYLKINPRNLNSIHL